MTEKKIQDYIGYYIGCEVIIDDKERGKLFGADLVPNSCNQIYYNIQTEEMRINDGDDFCMPYNDDADESPARIKPILRRIEDATKKEIKEYDMYTKYQTDGVHSVLIRHDTPESFHYLLKKGFDLWGLIDANLAVDSKTLTK
jgi:hypothetical protein